MLIVDNIYTNYSDSKILHGVSLEVKEGRVVGLLGRNGAGKTTTLRSIMNLTPPHRGRILFNGEDLRGKRPYSLARRGISYMPETRGIFPSLSVLENLTLVENRRPGLWTLDRIFEMFPRLYQRRGNGGSQISGGEQQMLSIARALLLNPVLLILDEPTEGLAPIIVKEIRDTLQQLKRDGLTLLLVEQNFHFATHLADDVYVLGKGQVQWQGSVSELIANTELQHSWLGV